MITKYVIAAWLLVFSVFFIAVRTVIENRQQIHLFFKECGNYFVHGKHSKRNFL